MDTTAEQFAELVATGALDLDLPGHGATSARFSALAALGRRDPVLARLGEGHADALAILAELGETPLPAAFWGVWAAGPRSVRAVRAGGEYVNRPGFWHGSSGVAACWFGGAVGVADPLVQAARAKPLDPHALAHLGAVDASLAGAAAVLRDAARRIDDRPAEADPRLARRVRATIEECATDVIDRVGRALGAAPLCMDREHGGRVADLTVYLRQSHAERDLEELGALIAGSPAPSWDPLW